MLHENVVMCVKIPHKLLRAEQLCITIVIFNIVITILVEMEKKFFLMLMHTRIFKLLSSPLI